MVILDDYVLEVGPFLDYHPGGRFALEQNIGRDVSKFFYGGYALENVNKIAPHTHSIMAKLTVNKLIFAKLIRTVPIHTCKILESTIVNSSTKCFTF